jgi:23S rRNA (uridine2552-2'-O)-methyltransferase
LLEGLRRSFTTVKHSKPPASRTESAELYVLATGFRGEGAASARTADSN